MSITYSIIGRLFRVDFVGRYSPEEVLETFDAAFANPAFPQEALFLMDLRHSDSVGDRSVAAIRELVDRLGARAAGWSERFAIVVSEPVQFGVMRMASVFAESHGIEVQIFEELREALSWLDPSGAPGE